jgi:hypothetical protein
LLFAEKVEKVAEKVAEIEKVSRSAKKLAEIGKLKNKDAIRLGKIYNDKIKRIKKIINSKEFRDQVRKISQKIEKLNR